MKTLGEIKASIVAMPKGKVLCRDSLPMEFFENSKEVVPSLLKT